MLSGLMPVNFQCVITAGWSRVSSRSHHVISLPAMHVTRPSTAAEGYMSEVGIETGGCTGMVLHMVHGEILVPAVRTANPGTCPDSCDTNTNLRGL